MRKPTTTEALLVTTAFCLGVAIAALARLADELDRMAQDKELDKDVLRESANRWHRIAEERGFRLRKVSAELWSLSNATAEPDPQ